MKKICFIDFDMSFMGGLERVLTTIANELCDEYEVHVISLNNAQGKPYFTFDKRVIYHVLFNDDLRIRTLMAKSFFSLIRYFRDNQIDIAFMMGNYPVPITLPVKPFVKTKLVFCDHGALENQLKNRKIMLFRRYAAKCADMVVTLTKQNHDAYIRIFHMDESRVDYIYNWIDESVFQYTGEYKTYSKYLLSVGRFGEEKGYDMLVPLGKKIFEKHPDWQWHIYGDGELFDQVKTDIETNGLAQNILLKGSTKKIYEIYKEYAILVLPSYREGLPLVLLEAKANKLPIVSFNITTGPREIVEDQKDGILIPPYDIDKMADNICLLIENEDIRKKMSDNAVNHLEKFRKDTILKKWIDFIEHHS